MNRWTSSEIILYDVKMMDTSYYTVQNYEWPHGGEPPCSPGAPTLDSSVNEKHKLLLCLNSLRILGLLITEACIT